MQYGGAHHNEREKANKAKQVCTTEVAITVALRFR